MSVAFQSACGSYSEFDMDRFDVGNGSLYVSRDRQHVFLEQTNAEGESVVRRADPDEISELWQKHRLIALLGVVHRMVHQ